MTKFMERKQLKYSSHEVQNDLQYLSDDRRMFQDVCLTIEENLDCIMLSGIYTQDTTIEYYTHLGSLKSAVVCPFTPQDI